MNRFRPWALILSLALAGVVGAASDSHASPFKMLQHFSSGLQHTGFNSVQCNDTNGFTHWNTRSISIYHNTANQGSGKATALQAAMQSWTNVPDTSYVLNYAGTTSSGLGWNGKSTMLWLTGSICTSNCVGKTALVLQQPGQVIIESDIVFNNALTWKTDGADHDTQGAATHELGHLLGIFHSDCTGAGDTMCAGYGGDDWRSLETDDKRALQCSENRYCATGAVPAPPLSLTVYNGNCYGHNDLFWTTSCEGTTRYELYRSTSSNFTSQTLEYSGLNLSRHVVVSGTTYFRIRACNANGCGSYRVADAPAEYVPWCY